MAEMQAAGTAGFGAVGWPAGWPGASAPVGWPSGAALRPAATTAAALTAQQSEPGASGDTGLVDDVVGVIAEGFDWKQLAVQTLQTVIVTILVQKVLDGLERRRVARGR